MTGEVFFGYLKGTGIDLVSVQEMKELNERTKNSFVKNTFSSREKEEAEAASNPWEYYAGRFAVKEAVFKAVAPFLGKESFDFRIVETWKEPDGSPVFHLNEGMEKVLKRAGVTRVSVSISHDSGFAIAIALAE